MICDFCNVQMNTNAKPPVEITINHLPIQNFQPATGLYCSVPCAIKDISKFYNDAMGNVQGPVPVTQQNTAPNVTPQQEQFIQHVLNQPDINVDVNVPLDFVPAPPGFTTPPEGVAGIWNQIQTNPLEKQKEISDLIVQGLSNLGFAVEVHKMQITINNTDWPMDISVLNYNNIQLVVKYSDEIVNIDFGVPGNNIIIEVNKINDINEAAKYVIEAIANKFQIKTKNTMEETTEANDAFEPENNEDLQPVDAEIEAKMWNEELALNQDFVEKLLVEAYNKPTEKF